MGVSGQLDTPFSCQDSYKLGQFDAIWDSWDSSLGQFDYP